MPTRPGAWRLLDLMDEFKIKGSVSTNGLTGERHPKIVREFADFGCEIVGHGWAQDVLSRDDDPETELAEMRKVTNVLTEAAGTRPVGWVSQGSAGSAQHARFPQAGRLPVERRRHERRSAVPEADKTRARS